MARQSLHSQHSRSATHLYCLLRWLGRSFLQLIDTEGPRRMSMAKRSDLIFKFEFLHLLSSVGSITNTFWPDLKLLSQVDQYYPIFWFCQAVTMFSFTRANILYNFFCLICITFKTTLLHTFDFWSFWSTRMPLTSYP